MIKSAEKLIEAFESFRESAYNLDEAWEEIWEYPEIRDITFSKKYPFNKSFDELVFAIGNWVDESTDAILDVLDK